MTTQTQAVELQDTIQIFRDVRERPSLQDLDRFIFVAQDVTDAERAARVRVLTLEMELTTTHLRYLLENAVLTDLEG